MGEEVTIKDWLDEFISQPPGSGLAVGDEVPLTDAQRGAYAARDRLAERMGADSTDIQVTFENIALELMQEGVVVDLDIHRWTGFKRLEGRDLGLESHAKNKAFRLGDKLLMPPILHKMANSLVTQMRANLERYSYRTFWGRFVPAGAYAEWKARQDELQVQFEAIGETLATNLEAIKAGSKGWGELRRLYTDQARVAWCRANRLAATDYNLDEVPGWFVEEYVGRIFAAMPEAEELRRSFDVVVKINFIPLPSMLLEDDLRSQRLREKSQMERDLEQYAQEQKRGRVDEFMSEIVATAYGYVYDVSSQVLSTMGRNQGRLLEPSLRQLQSLLSWGSSMNILEDAEFTAMLAKTRDIVEGREREDMVEVLGAMGKVAKGVMDNLGRRPQVKDPDLSLEQRDAVLGVGKRVSRRDVQRSRQVLGTQDVPELLVIQARRGQVKAQAAPEL